MDQPPARRVISCMAMRVELQWLRQRPGSPPSACRSRPSTRGPDKTLQAEYEVWRDRLPESLADSRTAELLEGVCDVDLDALDLDLPRGSAETEVGPVAIMGPPGDRGR